MKESTVSISVRIRDFPMRITKPENFHVCVIVSWMIITELGFIVPSIKRIGRIRSGDHWSQGKRNKYYKFGS